MQLEQEIRTYLRDNVLYLDDGLEYSDDTSLIGEGLIDSMGVMDLVAFVRTAYRIDVEQDEITTANFDSISNLAGYIRRKTERQPDPLSGRNETDARAAWTRE